MKLIRKDIRKEVRADGIEYYFIQFVYEKKSIIKNLFSYNSLYNEEIIEDEIVFSTFERAKEYAQLVDTPSSLLNETEYETYLLINPSNKNISYFNINNINFKIYFIHPWCEKEIDRTISKNEDNIQRMYYFTTEYISGYIIDNNVKYTFFSDYISTNRIRINELLSGTAYIKAVIFKNDTGENLYSNKYTGLIGFKYFDNPIALLKSYLGCRFKTREQIIEEEQLAIINKRKHDTIITNEILHIDNVLLDYKNVEDTEESELIQKRNKIIEKELKRIDEYKETLKSLIR